MDLTAIRGKYFKRLISDYAGPALRRYGSAVEPKYVSYSLIRWLFLRFLGMIYLIAFLSLWSQVDGLIGSEGILPAQRFLDAVKSQIGLKRYWLVPSLFWFNPSDAFLDVLCGGGVLSSILLIVGFLPRLSLLLLWLLYLSLVVIGQNFLSFQWDVLLLETGFLAIFFAPKGLWPRLSNKSQPSVLALWLLRVLLFKLMLQSGLVKLMSGDPTWRNLTALNFHYETQPLPTWIGWYAHQLPEVFGKVSVAIMFVIELVVAFLIFSPRKWRHGSAGILIGFQILIILTGNYCFFNLLTINLSLLLLDDQFFNRHLQQKLRLPGEQKRDIIAKGFVQPKRWLVTILAWALFFIYGLQIFNTGFFQGNPPQPFNKLLASIRPLRTLNSYGLFAVMTTVRNEIIVEGSNDQETWLPYEFKWKPGDLSRPPLWVAPHQPRLDWQMWFAALRSYNQNAWFVNFLVRILQSSESVLNLLAENPFPDAPPRYIRASFYEYHFTNPEKKAAHHTWWERKFKGLYCPVISIRQNPEQ
ncbi:lipase maturation factor family protein [candidate division KSB1 bacterium]|nr:lipase maturation factor family protein [candidate division KSB1 bacterium]NIR69526.1 lipase maturation factor family protein [candidate division KSB1 bacterium]NIS24294.1 lipase maturation factor family protein [candidate division KSB1 bacterium]NIT71209.1 lipase maturation factor family protein [candidate division KSB1 bacterium]NIU24913.1 lipase maturation factor family protein [candidate division KSB1 bacterium]